MTEREEFEVWAISEKLPTLREGDRYSWSDVQDYWIGWQARAALESAPAAQGEPVAPTMADALAAGDGTLHQSVDYWQARALAAEARLSAADVRESEDAARLNQVRAAINSYYLELDNRANGMAATYRALYAIEDSLGMSWIQGAARASKGGAA